MSLIVMKMVVLAGLLIIFLGLHTQILEIILGLLFGYITRRKLPGESVRVT